MKLFKISDINLVEPFTVLAKSRERAADYFVASLSRGFGHVPVIEYAVTQWNPKDLDQHKGLREILDQNHNGWAWVGPTQWESYNPFDIDIHQIVG